MPRMGKLMPPIGTVLYLDTGEMGLVMDSPENYDKARPKVVLLKDDGQEKKKKDKVVNLAEKDPGRVFINEILKRA